MTTRVALLAASNKVTRWSSDLKSATSVMHAQSYTRYLVDYIANQLEAWWLGHVTGLWGEGAREQPAHMTGRARV